ncbi:MAG: rRNA maturation RNase YbeY [Rhizobiales bacterium]|nr:rRNA maturation RNase YbeY [Hyphomicrobiales bacterium]
MEQDDVSANEAPVIEWSAHKEGQDLEIELILEDQRWSEIDTDFTFLKEASLLALSQEPTKSARLAMKSPHRLAVLVMSDDVSIRNLNKTYRGRDKATNVLSFPSTESLLPGEENEPVHIGDVILAYDYVSEEAKNEKKALQTHLSHLVVHGVLHLLGYDHETSEDAEAMETLEIKLMKQLGLENPYEGDPVV